MTHSILSQRTLKVKPSPTLAITQKAAELRAAGEAIISLSAGEPDFGPPQHILNAAKEAIDRGENRYTAVGGSPALKEAIRQKFKRENHLDYSHDEIIASTGGKQVIYNAMMASLNPGDEVLIPSPYWVSYPAMVLLADGKPITLETNIETNFKLTPEKLEASITPQTKWLILNSPSNPTGACYRKEELAALANVLLKHPHIWLFSDDIYEHMLYTGEKFYTMAEICPELKNRILTMNGVSKAYAMTGWRMGYGAGPKELIKAMQKIQSQSTSNPCSITQAATIAALNGPQDFMISNQALFKKRRDFIVDALNQCEGLTCLKPEGAFYVYPSCVGVIGKKTASGKVIETDADFTAYLLEEYKVATVLGEAFGCSPHIRISYATSDENLKIAADQIKKACLHLK